MAERLEASSGLYVPQSNVAGTGEGLKVAAGGSAFVPRATPHCFKNCTNREARLLILFTPADIEGFFDFVKAVDGRVPSDPEVLERLALFAPKYGLEVLGPSPL